MSKKRSKALFFQVLKYFLSGISWGWAFFVLINVIGVLTAGTAFLKPIMEDFLRQALGAAFVGVCSGTSAIVYTFEKLSLWKRIAIHSAIGLTGYFAAAYHLGWMPVDSGLNIALSILLGIVIFAVIWCCFYLFNRQEARKVNRRLRELEQDRPAE